MLAIICYQSPFISAVYGFFNGMAIEGGCRWGFDPIWEKVSSEKNSSEADTKSVKFYTETFKHTTAERVKWILLKDIQKQARMKNFEST